MNRPTRWKARTGARDRSGAGALPVPAAHRTRRRARRRRVRARDSRRPPDNATAPARRSRPRRADAPASASSAASSASPTPRSTPARRARRRARLVPGLAARRLSACSLAVAMPARSPAANRTARHRVEADRERPGGDRRPRRALRARPSLAGCGGGDDDTAADTADPFYGVAPEGLQNADRLRADAAGGLGTVRTVLQWSAIEADQGRSTTGHRSDQLLSQLALAGPRAARDRLRDAGGRTPPDVIDAPTNDEKTFDAYADFLKAAVDRYGTDGDFWTSFDRARTPTRRRSRSASGRSGTSRTRRPSGRRRPTRPPTPTLLTRSAKILDEGRSRRPGDERRHVRDAAVRRRDRLLRLPEAACSTESGVADAVDVVGVHPYGPDVEVGDRARWRRPGRRSTTPARDAPMWATEIGWGSNPKGGNDLSKTPEEQARRCSATASASSATDATSSGLDGVVWYTWHDSTETARRLVRVVRIGRARRRRPRQQAVLDRLHGSDRRNSLRSASGAALRRAAGHRRQDHDGVAVGDARCRVRRAPARPRR